MEPEDSENRPPHASNYQEATSEVGSPQAAPFEPAEKPSLHMDEALLRTMLELQNKTLLSLIEAVKSPASSAVSLPEFDPEKPDADARAWCNTVDMCLAERPLTGSALIMAISGALKGSASRWLSQVSFAGMQWPEFRDLFTARYDCVETAAATLISLQNSRPNENECLSAYAARLITTLTAKWQKMNAEQIAVSTVLSHLVQFDGRLQRLAFTADIMTREKLQRELTAFSFMKRKIPSQTHTNQALVDSKRFKTMPPLVLPLRQARTQN